MLVSLSFLACQQVTIVIESIPENTPPNATIYIMGQFNYWDPGDGRYLLKRNELGEYVAKLPRGFGTMEYRFSRGNWESIEGDICGRQEAPRQVELNYADTVRHQIRSWVDLGPTNCGQLTIVLNELPKQTPKDASIFLASNWNGWNPADSTYQLEKRANGNYAITLGKRHPYIEFKFTRGDWPSGEVDNFGQAINNRVYTIGQHDTVYLSVKNWDDLVSPNAQYLTIIIDELPINTPKNTKLYLASNLNSWNAQDHLFTFKKDQKGSYYLNIKKTTADTLHYKITRGDWDKVEGDETGSRIPNRKFIFNSTDTLHLQIRSWEDLEN